MEHFFEVFEKMERQGPESAESTLRAFKAIPNKNHIETILDIGCGKGAASLALAGACKAKITAEDNHTPSLESLIYWNPPPRDNALHLIGPLF